MAVLVGGVVAVLARLAQLGLQDALSASASSRACADTKACACSWSERSSFFCA